MTKMLTWLAVAVLALAACGSATAAGSPGVTLTRDAAIGAKYRTPGPRKCRQAAGSGDGLSAADARALVICFMEGEISGTQEVLVSNVSVQVAAPRPYVHVNDSYEQVDPRRPVRDIRGSLDYYACSTPSSYVPGPNLHLPVQLPCRAQHYANGTGTCYHDGFGEWRCVFRDMTATIEGQKPSGPPTSD